MILAIRRLIRKKICISSTSSLEEYYEIGSFFIDHIDQYQMHKDSNDIEHAVFVKQLYKPCQLFSLSDILCK